MRECRRLKIARRCGSCGAIVDPPNPMCYIKLPEVRRELLRCETCAGEAPPELPLNVDTEDSPNRERMSPLRKTALGYTRERLEAVAAATARMLGEREP